ncbi:TLR4 interactor with leucine rich repeats [Betta splendens]|uniref:TLR4 interactor with leucine rich repeats n=1 Tax=Betta splendens TaxID=158456 RepID=A0A6P7NZU8_BETSP|nr:TLR4 interactor with leucine rich repeats [Betta splendens]
MESGNSLTRICFFLWLLNGFGASSPAPSSCPDRCDCQHPQHLACANRGLRIVPKPAARVPEDVQVFSLGGNFISNISAFDFTRYSDLVRLNLQYNQIRTIHPKAFEKLLKLEELYLGHNHLSNIPVGTLQPLKKLTILYGNNNDIKKITPELFANLDNLVKLRLDGNSIDVLQESVFKSLTRLHYLHLESNKLQHIHRNAFSELTNLRFLNLAHNRQSALRSVLTFSQLKALTTLLLSDNQIHHIGKHVFQNLSRLSELSLSNNRLSQLDGGALRGLSGLRELLIDGNELREIPAGLLDPLERVEELDFSNNRISSVDALAFSQLKRLKVLKLKNNLLTSLSGDMFALNKALYDLDLHGNNWTCDCRLEELKRWMTVAHSQGKLLTVFVRCHHPLTLRGKYLDYVNSSHLQPFGNWTHLCRRQTGPEESRGGGVLVKMEGREIDETSTEGQVVNRKREGVDSRQRHRDGAILGKDGVNRKRDRQEGVGVQGDQGGPETESSSLLDQKKARKVSLNPKSRPAAETTGKRTKGRRMSNVTPKTEPPISTSSHRNTSHTGLSTTPPAQAGGMFDLLWADPKGPLPVITDPCAFNRHFITNVSVDQVTSSTVTVSWTTRDHHRYTPGPGPGPDEVHYRLLFDRFGTADRFPRYVYARGASRSVTLRELSPDVTYMVCVEGVVGGSVCQVAPRDHCAGLVTLPEGPALTLDLQLATVATLAANAALLLALGAAWLGRSLRRRLRRRRSAVHVRHMYSTRRPFRHAGASAAVAADFTSYQSSRPARLAPLEAGDLIEFPCDRFLDTGSTRRDSDMQRFTD